MQITTIHDKAVLAYITVGLWSARKLDKKATRKITADSGAAADAATVNKHLLATADAQLKEILRLANRAREVVQQNTLPWDDAGNRLLSNEHLFTVVGEVTSLRNEFYAKVDEFIRDYPVLRAQALAALGDLANEDDYPQPDAVRDKFSMRLILTPLPTTFGDLRTGMSAEQVDALRDHFEHNIALQFNHALAEAWDRLRDHLQKLAERMGFDDEGKRKVFRDTTVENLRETATLLDKLNVFDDADLRLTCRMVRENISAYSADDLRANDALAEKVRGEAEALIARMAEFA